MRSKYHARKVTENGITFDSMAEYRRYRELVILQQAGEIDCLEVHPVYELQEGFRYGAEKVKPITYEADFSYVEQGRRITEDVKGVRTEAFKIKAKMFKHKYHDYDFRIVEA